MNFNQAPKKENIQTPESKIDEGIDFIFKQHSELEKVGTKEEYSKFLRTIFPNSICKDIVYHGGEVKEFIKREEGSYFTKNIEYALKNGDIIIPALLNITRGVRLPYISKTSVAETFKEQIKEHQADGIIGEEEMGIVTKNGKSFIASGESLVVFEPNQIHMLGSKKDIEEFKNFVSNIKEK
jgi:hypothetical protein